MTDASPAQQDPDTLHRKTVRGLSQSLGGQVVRVVISLVTVAVLARLLGPQDFGLYAMAFTLITLVNPLRDFGLTQAVVQRPRLTHAELSGAFWLNMAVGTALAVVTIIMAPLAGWMYGESQVSVLLAILAGVHLVGAAGGVYRARLVREMAFGRLRFIQIMAALAALGTAVSWAVWRPGPWALVIQQYTLEIVALGLLWVFNRWIPSRPRAASGYAHWFQHGRNTASYQLLANVSRGLDELLIGVFAGTFALGIFNRIAQIVRNPVRNLQEVMNPLALGTLSRVQDNDSAFSNWHASFSRLVFWLCAVLLAFACGIPEPIVRILLGPEWAAHHTLLPLLATQSVLFLVDRTLLWPYWARLRTHCLPKWTLLTLALYVPAVTVGVQFGPTGLLVGAITASTLMLTLRAVALERQTSLPVKAWLGAIPKPLFVGLGGAAAGFITSGSVVQAGLIERLLWPVLAIVLAMIVLVWAFARDDLRLLINVVRSKNSRT